MEDLEVRTYAMPHDDARALMQLVGAEYVSLFLGDGEEHAVMVAYDGGRPVKYAHRFVRDGVTYCTDFRDVPERLVSRG